MSSGVDLPLMDDGSADLPPSGGGSVQGDLPNDPLVMTPPRGTPDSIPPPRDGPPGLKRKATCGTCGADALRNQFMLECCGCRHPCVTCTQCARSMECTACPRCNCNKLRRFVIGWNKTDNVGDCWKCGDRLCHATKLPGLENVETIYLGTNPKALC